MFIFELIDSRERLNHVLTEKMQQLVTLAARPDIPEAIQWSEENELLITTQKKLFIIVNFYAAYASQVLCQGGQTLQSDPTFSGSVYTKGCKEISLEQKYASF